MPPKGSFLDSIFLLFPERLPHESVGALLHSNSSGVPQGTEGLGPTKEEEADIQERKISVARFGSFLLWGFFPFVLFL